MKQSNDSGITLTNKYLIIEACPKDPRPLDCPGVRFKIFTRGRFLPDTYSAIETILFISQVQEPNLNTNIF